MRRRNEARSEKEDVEKEGAGEIAGQTGKSCGEGRGKEREREREAGKRRAGGRGETFGKWKRVRANDEGASDERASVLGVGRQGRGERQGRLCRSADRERW